MDRKNSTQQDAFERVLDAKMGSLADATDDYLMHLQRNLYLWVDEIGQEMARRCEAAGRKSEGV